MTKPMTLTTAVDFSRETRGRRRLEVGPKPETSAPPPGRVPRAVAAAIERVGLGDRARAKLRTLSGGMLRRAGIAQARKEGRPHGRPRTASLKADEVLRLKAEWVSHSEIARRLGIGRTSVRRILAPG